jgi:hypothetical protein
MLSKSKNKKLNQNAAHDNHNAAKEKYNSTYFYQDKDIKNIESSDENSCDTWWYDQLDIKIGCDDIDDVKTVSHENHCESN